MTSERENCSFDATHKKRTSSVSIQAMQELIFRIAEKHSKVINTHPGMLESQGLTVDNCKNKGVNIDH